MQDIDAVTYCLNFGKDMSGKYHAVPGAQLQDEVTNFTNLDGVQSDRRLVKYNDIWFMDDGLRYANPLLITF